MFDAYHLPNSSNPLVFDPTGKCPSFVVDPKIARPTLEEQSWVTMPQTSPTRSNSRNWLKTTCQSPQSIADSTAE